MIFGKLQQNTYQFGSKPHHIAGTLLKKGYDANDL